MSTSKSHLATLNEPRLSIDSNNDGTSDEFRQPDVSSIDGGQSSDTSVPATVTPQSEPEAIAAVESVPATPIAADSSQLSSQSSSSDNTSVFGYVLLGLIAGAVVTSLIFMLLRMFNTR